MPDSIEFWVSGEWTMVYLNGHLATYGSHYAADEWLQQHNDVTVVQDDAGLSVPDGHHPIKDLADVIAARVRRDNVRTAAAELRADAAALLAKAEALETP